MRYLVLELEFLDGSKESIDCVTHYAVTDSPSAVLVVRRQTGDMAPRELIQYPIANLRCWRSAE